MVLRLLLHEGKQAAQVGTKHVACRGPFMICCDMRLTGVAPLQLLHCPAYCLYLCDNAIPC